MPGLFLYDLYYNFMMVAGDPFGLIPDEQHAIGQPFAAAFIGGHYDWVKVDDPSKFVGKLTDTDDALTGYSARAYNSGVHLWTVEFDEDKYQESLKQGSLLGMGLLKWSTHVLPGTGESEGRYFGRADYHDRNNTDTLEHLVRFNEWSGDLLWMKLRTVGILTATTVAGIYGGKFAYRKYMA